ncbi:MAG: PilN domain-containing protein [Pseudomonadota bacterium]
MPRINLLPWREEQRKIRQKNFMAAALGSVIIAGAVIFTARFFVDKAIEHQDERNKYLQAEITLLDKQIEEIENLESQKERLLARMEIIEQLQKSRPEVVHLFDELVTTLPEGVHLEMLEQTSNRLQLRGSAQSSTRVSTYMRRIDASPWLTDPDLGGITVTEREPRGRVSQFSLFATQTSPKADEEEE